MPHRLGWTNRKNGYHLYGGQGFVYIRTAWDNDLWSRVLGEFLQVQQEYLYYNLLISHFFDIVHHISLNGSCLDLAM